MTVACLPGVRVVMAVSVGYAGTFVWDDDDDGGGAFRLAVSVIKPAAASPWQTDVDVPHAVLHQCRAQGGKPAVAWGQVLGRWPGWQAVGVRRHNHHRQGMQTAH